MKKIAESIDKHTGNSLELRVLHELGQTTDGYLNPKKVGELWDEFQKHDFLFTEHTAGKFEPFFYILINPGSTWLEIYDTTEDKPLGVIMATKIIHGYDSECHFAVWNGKARGKEDLFRESMKWIFDQYELRRLSAHVIGFQRGVIRFVERMGFTHEGEKREAVMKDDKWFGLVLYGLTLGEFESTIGEA